MRTALDPFSFLVTSIAGWMNQHQHHVIEYLMEENRVLREQIGNHRLRFSDAQRRRLAAKAKKLGREDLGSGGDGREPGDTFGLAPKTDCQEIRWQRASHCRPRPNRSGHRGAGHSNGRGKSKLGLSPDSRSPCQSRTSAGAQYDCRYSEAAWD